MDAEGVCGAQRDSELASCRGRQVIARWWLPRASEQLSAHVGDCWSPEAHG